MTMHRAGDATFIKSSLIRFALGGVLTLCFSQLGLAKAMARPPDVFDKRLRSLAKARMLRRVVTRQFSTLTWDTRTMTEPMEGVARNYVFLIHSFSPDRGTKYLGDRDALSRRPLFFASLISDLPALHLEKKKWSAGKPKMRTHTWFELGFILSARPANVALNCPHDTGFNIRKPYPKTLGALRKKLYQDYPGGREKVARKKGKKRPRYDRRQVGPYDPKYILDRTDETNNEVLMHGSYGGSKVQVAALLIRTDALTNKDFIPADQLAPYIDAAHEWGIPVVRIPTYMHVHHAWAQPKENARHPKLLLHQLQRWLHGDLPTKDWRKKIWR